MALNNKRILSVKSLLANAANIFYVSVISFWEIAIKLRIGKINVEIIDLRKETINGGIQELKLSSIYLDTFLLLPMHYKDLFDHMILAQTKHENMTIITGDSFFKKYLPDTIVI